MRQQEVEGEVYGREMYKVRTDLAMENGEKYEKDNVEMLRCEYRFRKSYNQEKDIRTTVVKIESRARSQNDGEADRHLYHSGSS